MHLRSSALQHVNTLHMMEVVTIHMVRLVINLLKDIEKKIPTKKWRDVYGT